MIYNKSSHPVEVKKISIRLWSLRDEIEAAIERRMKECEAAGIPLYINDIKKFYNMNMEDKLTDQSNVLQMPTKEDSVTALMESLGNEGVENSETSPAPEEAPKAEDNQRDATEKSQESLSTSESQAASNQEGPIFEKAENILAQQASEGLAIKGPNPILVRPYERQAPDLNKISYGFSLLSDLNMDHLLTFTKDKFLQGQSVVIEFLIPQSFMISAEVSYCHHYSRTSKIISSTKPDYRVQCHLTYALSGERDSLRNFLLSVEPIIPETKKKTKPDEDNSLGL